MTLTFRGLTSRDGALLRWGDTWVEFSPFWNYTHSQSAPWLRAALSHRNGFPQPVRRRIPVNVTIPATSPEVAYERARASRATTAKVKVADVPGQADADCSRLAAVRDALGPEARLRIDVNGRWDLDTALDLLPRYDQAAGGLEYAEQPVMATDDLARLRRAVNVPIAADESIRLNNPSEVTRLDAADIAVVKVHPLGGVQACLDLVEKMGLPAVVSSALDSPIGIYAGVRLAAALPQLPYACGLGTLTLFEGLGDNPATAALIPTDGYIDVYDEAPLPPAAVTDPDLVSRWRTRYECVAAQLPALD